MPDRSRRAIAAMIDHTLLRPEAVGSEVVSLCREAQALEVAAVCVSPSLAGVAAAELAGSRLALAVVVGFPSGAHASSVKGVEAAGALEQGASEIDMVIDLGAASAGRWDQVVDEVAAVRGAIGATTLLKVIVESALWSEEQLIAACRAAVEGGADMVKTSTGFHPAGGATVVAVATMAKAVGPAIGVKASGGIGSAEQALALVEAGATRLGLSRTAVVLAGLDG